MEKADKKKMSKLVSELTGQHLPPSGVFSDKRILNILELHRDRMISDRSVNARIMECIDVIQAYARLELDKKVRLKRKSVDHLNALALGINMLGEELKQSTVSLREKETLLKEIHHRVKNNLQIISSLLSLQSNKQTQGSGEDLFREARARIKSIALVHEHLYNSEDLTGINVAEYAKNLLDNIQSIFDLYQDITLKTELQVLLVSIDLAVPIGLIINELVTNAYKYAFDKNHKGVLTVQLTCTKGGKSPEATLVVSDNGNGFPKGFRLEQSDSLGLHLVEMLAGQLNGNMKISRSTKGATVTVVFRL